MDRASMVSNVEAVYRSVELYKRGEFPASQHTHDMRSEYCMIAVHVWRNGMRARTCRRYYTVASVRTLRHQLGSATSLSNSLLYLFTVAR